MDKIRGFEAQLLPPEIHQANEFHGFEVLAKVEGGWLMAKKIRQVLLIFLAVLKLRKTI